MRPRILIYWGLIALAFLSPWSPVRREIAPLAGRNPSDQDVLGSSGWNGTSPNAGPLPYRMRRLALRDSSVGGDGFSGEHTTGWYVAKPDAAVLVAGYPNLRPNRLEVEALAADGSTSIVAFHGIDPGEGWAAWRIPLPAKATAFRIHGIDGTHDFHGWLGFSAPFRLPLGLSWDGWMVWQTLTTVALAVVPRVRARPPVAGPGSRARRLRSSSRDRSSWPSAAASAGPWAQGWPRSRWRLSGCTSASF